VGAYLVNEALKHGIEVYYWRKGNYEVDFVMTKGQKIVAVEVKSGKRQTALPGLEMFKKEFNTYRVITVGSFGIAPAKFLETPLLEWFN